MNLSPSTRSVVVLGAASLLLGGAVVGSLTTAESDLGRNGGAARPPGDRTEVVTDRTDVLLTVRDALRLGR